MKKILLTTALVGSLVSGISAANAETKVSGNLGISYLATSNESGTNNGDRSYNGFGNESQINIANSGDLNNGMKYAAGFSWEIDGGETLGHTATGASGYAFDSAGASTEGTYIEFISGDTTFGIGADRDTSLDGLGVNFVGFGYRTISGVGTSTSSVATGANSSITNSSYGTNNSFGFYANQKVAGGTVGVNYIPNTGHVATQDIANGATKANIDGGESYYSATYKASVSGFDIHAGVNSTTGVSTFSDQEGRGISLAYTMGKTKVGASYGELDKSVATGGAKNQNDTTEIGIAHAVSDNTSVGLTYTTTDSSLAGKTEEEIYTASVGYNLGAVSIQIQLKDAQDIAGTAGLDAQQIGMYVGTKF